MEELEHSGVKGMKWGVRKTRNAIARYSADKANSKLTKIDSKVAKRAAVERLSKAVTGNGLSSTRTFAGSALHNYARQGVGKNMNRANELNYGANRSINSALSRNAKTSAKLAKKVLKKTGKAKEKAQKNLEAWNAYSKKYSKKAKETNTNTNSLYSSVDKNRVSMDKSHNAKIKAINNAVYKANKHGDTNQALDAEYKRNINNAKKAYNAVTGEKGKAAASLLGYASGKAARGVSDSAQYVRASSIRKGVKRASKNQVTKYRTIN